MAEVRKAVDLADGITPIAIKYFCANLETNRLFIESYSREQASLMRLDHPNIVRLIDCGVDDNARRYLVLEWLESSLTDRLSSGPYPTWDAFFSEVGEPVLDALVYSFAKDVLHRDLKPGNILFSSDGVVKIADFGISKLRNIIAPGLTIGNFRSEPYAPPENDDSRQSETRDVFGFGALAVACLAKQTITSYAELYGALQEIVIPAAISEMLHRALSQNPSLRPQNIVHLREEVIRACSGLCSPVTTAPPPRCFIQIESRVERDIFSSLNDPHLDFKKFVLEDIGEVWGIKQNRNSNNIRELSIFASQFLYQARVNSPHDSTLTIFRAIPLQSSVLEFNRDTAWSGRMTFHAAVGAQIPRDGFETISTIINGVAENEVFQKEVQRVAQADELFKRWTSILFAKRDIEAKKQTPIRFNRARQSGNRLILSVEYPIESAYLGQSSIVEFSTGQTFSGEIEELGAGHVVFWSEDPVLAALHQTGTIQLDSKAARQAINRQRQALDAIRFRRAARPELRELLIDPGTALHPISLGEIAFAQDRLDESKQSAVRMALGADSFLVVEGPPGTGKTRFITEVVVQVLRQNPSSKILISSQTHVALDNALGRIREVSPDIKLWAFNPGFRRDIRSAA